MTIQLIIPVTDTDWADYYRLRWQLLRAPWGQYEGSEKDALELESFHILAKENEKHIGVGRMHLNSPAEAQIRYMAVAPQWQGQGVGRMILARLEEEARRLQARRIVLQSRCNAIEFYKKCGYREMGPGSTLFGVIEHVMMEKQI